MCRSFLTFLIFLIFCGVAQARDPFKPYPGAACIKQVEPLQGWLLQGVIGRKDRFQAWLLSPQGKAIKVRTGHPFPLPPWQPETLNRRSLSLTVKNSCLPQNISFQLKGRIRDKDDHFAAGTLLPDVDLRK